MSGLFTFRRFSDYNPAVRARCVHKNGRHQLSLAQYSTTDQAVENNEHQRKGIIITGTIPSHGQGMQIEQYAELRRSFNQNDVNKFGALIGDFNPVHFPVKASVEQNDEKKPTFEDPIVHGMLLSSIFSTIFGTLIPGCLYRSQSLKFHHPVFIDEMIHGRVVVKKLRQINARRGGGGVLCTCDTTIIKPADSNGDKSYITSPNTNDKKEDNILCISGEAQVWLPGVKISAK